ncbi:PHD finger protein 21A-like isoform X2 [Hyposmocoma kahamanoa]|uniref:PHD finger protein 21A-like isoform X2 n=1 Tax=Hyposmocoma kahamanoa TaxID=1477025 RepID=UPI000E6D6C0A|nr:PHD finger protein 21A-like isoform X2 [Hyposmocoma kahamanoa]
MEVSNEIKEDIRKTQSDLKNAIRVHQIWVARLQEDENNVHLKTKVKEAEKDIIVIGQAQKLVVDRLRRELELYQQRLRARNKQVNIENDNRYVAQQLRDHQIQYRNRHRSVSLLKPSVLNEIHIKSENNHDDAKDIISDSENETKSFIEKENSNHSEMDDKEKYQRTYSQMPNSVHGSRNNFANALNKVKESLIIVKVQQNDWHVTRSDSDSSAGVQHSPSPSPPPLPEPGEPVTQETFMRLIGLVTHSQRELLEKKRNERRKRSTTSTNRTDFLYGNFDMLPAKRKKYNNFPYLQTHTDPPQTRSAKLRKQQNQSCHNKTSRDNSREGSPSGSSTENKDTKENKGWGSNKPAWVAALPAGLSVEPVFSPAKKVCHGCGRSDVPSLLVWCSACKVCVHTGCGVEGRCCSCRAPLPDPLATAPKHHTHQIYRDKLAERKRLQEKNIELCVELRKLEARAATLKENLDEHNAEKRQLLADQIKTQRNLQKLLDFISQFKETSISIRSTSISETGSEISKSNED